MKKKKIDISKFSTFDDLQKEWMGDPKFVAEWKKVEPEYQIARQMIGARIKKKMSQEELAKKVGTGQAVISRLEGMNASPSLSLLKRVASALEIKITITIQ
jgi:ribosome-binding protein aMBF1 (putative translation factor)